MSKTNYVDSMTPKERKKQEELQKTAVTTYSTLKKTLVIPLWIQND